MRDIETPINLPPKQHREAVDIPLTARVLFYLVVAFIFSILFSSCVYTGSLSYEQDGKSIVITSDGKTVKTTFGVKR